MSEREKQGVVSLLAFFSGVQLKVKKPTCVPGITSSDDNSQWSKFCLFSCWAAHTETRAAALRETHWRHHFLSHYLNTNTAFVSSSDRQTAVFWWLLKMHNPVVLRRCCSLDKNEGQLYLLGDLLGEDGIMTKNRVKKKWPSFTVDKKRLDT